MCRRIGRLGSTKINIFLFVLQKNEWNEVRTSRIVLDMKASNDRKKYLSIKSKWTKKLYLTRRDKMIVTMRVPKKSVDSTSTVRACLIEDLVSDTIIKKTILEQFG